MSTVRPAGHSLNVALSWSVLRVSGLASLNRGNSSLNALGGSDSDRGGKDIALEYATRSPLDYPVDSDKL